MIDKEKELELLKKLPAHRRIELLEEKVSDLENLLMEIWNIFKLFNISNTDIDKFFSERS